MSQYLIIAPIVLPLLVAALQLLVGERRRRTVLALSIVSCVGLLVLAAMLMSTVSDGGALAAVYRIGDWPARFGIVLVADRLSALMVLLTSVLAVAILPYALGRWQHRGGHFQPLLQFLLVGLDGAFLTGDLFNLFVFFEVLLAASYGLALHGSGVRRVSAGLHYIAVNLTASMLFLIGVSLIFGVTGTLNMAALAALIPHVPGHTRALLHAGAAILGVAFLIKTAMWPLGFWLPRTYAVAASPVAAMFALMTKVGIYVLLRLGLLLFGDGAGPASAHFGSDWMLWGGVATVVAGTIGMLGARDLGKLAGYNVVISSGTLLGAIGLQQPAVTAGALAYLVISTLAIAAFFLVAGLLTSEGDEETGDTLNLEPYADDELASEDLYAAEDESRVVIPAPIAMLAGSFFACAVLLAGLPPLSGFLAKFAMLAPMLDMAPRSGTLVLFTLVIVAGFCTVIAMCRAGIQIFWADTERVFPKVRLSETSSILLLLGLCLLLTVAVQWPMHYLRATAAQIHAPANYIRAVLPAGGAAMIRRWLPYPILSALLLLIWLMFSQSLAPGAILLGALLGVGLAKVFGLLRPPKAHLHNYPLLGLLFVRVVLDIFRSNLAVARIILHRHRRTHSGFVAIPLTLTDRHGLAVLACIITSTPGTIWVSYDSARHVLLIHVLDLVDEQQWIDTITQRYERLLLEIFQ